MSSLQKMNNNYFELLTKYVNVVESYHKLEKRISDLEKHNKFDLDQKITEMIKKEWSFMNDKKAKATKDPAPKKPGSKLKTKNK